MAEEFQPAKTANPDPVDDELEQLRSLLMSRYQRKFNDLNSEWQDSDLFKERVDNSLHQIFEPQDQNRQKISYRMQNSLVESLGIASHTQPIRLAQSLAPVIGPAITASITRALSEFRQTIDEMLLHSISPKGLYWRYLSSKTGEPFSRIVQRKTKDFGVESVVLVHKTSRVVVTEQHGSKLAQDQLELNKEYLSSKFSELAEVGTVTQNPSEIELAELYLRDGKVPALMCYGQHLNLICIHWGGANDVFKARVFGLLQSIHKQYATDLKNFHRGNTDLEALAIPVQQLFVAESDIQEYNPSNKKSVQDSNKFKWLFLGAFTLLALGFYFYLQQRWERSDLLKLLAENPHIHLNELKNDQGKWKLKLIADPSVFDAKKFIEQWQISMPTAKPVDIELLSIISLHPLAIEARANQILKPPKGLSLAVDEQRVIHVQGKGLAAHQNWLNTIERDWSKVTGATAVTTKHVIKDWPDELILPIFEKYFITMERENEINEAGQVELKLLLDKLRAIKEKQEKQNIQLNIGLVGLSVNSDDTQDSLRLKRAQVITDILLAANVSNTELYTLSVVKDMSRKGVLVHLRADTH